MKIILSSRRHHYVTRVSTFLVMVALITGMVGCGGTPYSPEIRDWYDLDAVRNNLGGDYILMTDLDSSSPGYSGLASPTANEGKGWEPIGIFDDYDQELWFTGTFDGQGYEIRDLFIDRPDETVIGLFGYVYEGGIIKNSSVMNGTVIGGESVGGLVGVNGLGTITDCYSSGSVSGNSSVGGLVGANSLGTITDCYSTSSVSGDSGVGGLVGGQNLASTVSHSYSTGAVSGESFVGGLVGIQGLGGTVSHSYSTGAVSGGSYVGGLVGGQSLVATVSNSYSTGMVSGDETVGGLVGDNGGGDENTVISCYATGNVIGNELIGGLVASNGGNVTNCYATGSVSGNTTVGGLVGQNIWSEWGSYDRGTVTNSYSTGSVTGNSSVGGLVGCNNYTVINSFWDTETSGQATSDGGTGKNMTEMKDITTFTDTETEGLDEPWDIIAVANPGTRNPSYIWNIVDTVTCPFLSWQP